MGTIEGRSAPSTLPAFRTSGGNLPFEITSFVGRRRELSEAKSLLATARLLTLAGMGGVGKTRLALRVAADTRRRFADGVWLIELSEVHDPSLLLDVVTSSLGIRDRTARPVEDALVEFLAARDTLLVLDNCEQVVEAVAGLVRILLQTCPGIRVLATSREPLGIGGEIVFRLPPLTNPDTGQSHSLLGLAKYDAVALFEQRAAAVVPGFELTEASCGTVTEICRRLEGIPLAIELAAARLRMMSLEQLLQRLTDRFTLLTLGERTAPSRQQTLRLSVDWSHELCTPLERMVWARASVFAGGFELDDAEGVCGDGFTPAQVVDAVTSLVDKSVLLRGSLGTVVRFRMLETVREYGLDELRRSDDLETTRRRHREWFLSPIPFS
ncbi:MAG: hypothetical protein EOP24_44140 [Hyphomicrobiales bacterium]|nr:MAG: hypothetical protein EOP24_44140 [Hyphomicrobiales bacterium]